MLKGYIDSLSGLHWVDIKRCRSQRTLKQNAYYWAVCLPIVAQGMADCFGEDVTSDEAHEFCKDRFLKRPLFNRKTGERAGHTVPSTYKLDTAEFAKYLDNVIRFASEQLGVYVPDPCEYVREEKEPPLTPVIQRWEFAGAVRRAMEEG